MGLFLIDFCTATAVDDMEAETSSGVSSPRHAWSNFDKTTFSQGSEQWLKELKDLPQGQCLALSLT